MKDKRTFGNTPRREIDDIALDVRAEKVWKMQKEQKLLKEIRCRMCDASFMQSRRWQVFCSDKCRSDFNVQEREKAEAQLEAENQALRDENLVLRQELETLKGKSC